MSNSDFNPDQKGYDKDRKILTQFEKVLRAFFEEPKTMKMVDVETKVMRENVCRYVRRLRKQSRIAIVKYGRCPITHDNHVGFYTTNPDLFPSDNQLTLFPNEN